MTCKR